MPLIKKMAAFWQMRFKNKVMFVINFILCGLAKAAINLLPLRYLTPYFGKFQKTLTISLLISNKQSRQVWMIGKSVRLAAKYTPWDSSCLTQAMVAKFWCRLYRIPYVLYIGFAKSATETNRYIAHAWITSGSVAVTGGYGLKNYHVVSSYVYLGGNTLPNFTTFSI